MTKEKHEMPNGVGAVVDSAEKGKVSSKSGAGLDLLGSITMLLLQSPPHRHFFLSDLEWLILPALKQGQLRIFQGAARRTIGFATWAMVSDDIEKTLMSGAQRLRPTDWRSGENLWLMQLVVPGAKPEAVGKILSELFKGPFGGKSFKMSVFDSKTKQKKTTVFGPKLSDEQILNVADYNTPAVEE